MASEQLQQALKAQADYKEALSTVTDLEQMRNLDATVIPTWSGPLDADIAVAEIDLGGISAVELTPPGANPDRVIMYLHGGGLVLGSPDTVMTPISRSARLAKARAILPRYRLAPEHVYPAQVEDVVTAYLALIASGVAPEGIVIAGESAGGGLVCMTLLALKAGGHPQPAGAVPISPMVDFEFKGGSWQENAENDGFVTHELAIANIPMFLPDGDPVAESPLNKDLSGLPPLLVQVGGHEGIRDDAIAFAEKAQSQGVQVQLEVWPEMVHLWHNFSFLPEAHDALDHIGQFVAERTAAVG